LEAPQIEYEERYVCFIDILGFAEAIAKPDHPFFQRTPAYFHEALISMRKIKKAPDFIFVGPEINQFSDSVVMSCPVSSNNLHMILQRTIWLQQYLLRSALPTCGAITKGKHYHKDGCIFGPALVQAANMEKKDAKTPRVILSAEVKADVDAGGLSGFMLGHDNDFFYVKYIEHWGIVNNVADIDILKQIILHGLSDNNINIKCKYQWLAQKYDIWIDNLASSHPNIPNLKKILSP
jgi:hypothetical protein